MNNNTIVSKTALIDCLVDNNRFKNHRVNAEQIGAEDFRTWCGLVYDLQKSAYAVYEAQENHADTAAPRRNLFANVKTILNAIGDLELVDKDGNKHKAPVTIDDQFSADLADLCANYAGRIGSDKAPALQLVESRLNNAKTTLRKYAKINGVDPNTIKALEDEIENLEDERAELMETPDMCINKPVINSPNAFRKQFECHLARTIVGQKAQSWEEYETAKEERRKASNKKSNERQKAKRAEAAKAKAAA